MKFDVVLLYGASRTRDVGGSGSAMLMEALALLTFTSVSSSTTATLHCHTPWSVALMLVILIPQSTSSSLAKCSILPPSAFRLEARGY